MSAPCQWPPSSGRRAARSQPSTGSRAATDLPVELNVVIGSGTACAVQIGINICGAPTDTAHCVIKHGMYIQLFIVPIIPITEIKCSGAFHLPHVVPISDFVCFIARQSIPERLRELLRATKRSIALQTTTITLLQSHFLNGRDDALHAGGYLQLRVR